MAPRQSGQNGGLRRRSPANRHKGPLGLRALRAVIGRPTRVRAETPFVAAGAWRRNPRGQSQAAMTMSSDRPAFFRISRNVVSEKPSPADDETSRYASDHRPPAGSAWPPRLKRGGFPGWQSCCADDSSRCGKQRLNARPLLGQPNATGPAIGADRKCHVARHPAFDFLARMPRSGRPQVPPVRTTRPLPFSLAPSLVWVSSGSLDAIAWFAAMPARGQPWIP
jgi:hypothetical protein